MSSRHPPSGRCRQFGVKEDILMQSLKAARISFCASRPNITGAAHYVSPRLFPFQRNASNDWQLEVIHN